jgi:hypothetical protein
MKFHAFVMGLLWLCLTIWAWLEKDRVSVAMCLTIASVWFAADWLDGRRVRG